MEQFLAESYLPPGKRAIAEQGVARVRAAADARIRLLQTLYVVEDEICLYVFESESAELVETASRAAGLELERVVPVVRIAEGETQ